MKINSIDSSGKIREYDVILSFHNTEFDKDYLVYTDNVYNELGELQIYINEYNSNEFELVSKKIEDKEEYKKIKTEVNSILLTLKNENAKLTFCE